MEYKNLSNLTTEEIKNNFTLITTKINKTKNQKLNNYYYTCEIEIFPSLHKQINKFTKEEYDEIKKSLIFKNPNKNYNYNSIEFKSYARYLKTKNSKYLIQLVLTKNIIKTIILDEIDISNYEMAKESYSKITFPEFKDIQLNENEL